MRHSLDVFLFEIFNCLRCSVGRGVDVMKNDVTFCFFSAVGRQILQQSTVAIPVDHTKYSVNKQRYMELAHYQICFVLRFADRNQ